jgi:hypothetical protein
LGLVSDLCGGDKHGRGEEGFQEAEARER